MIAPLLGNWDGTAVDGFIPLLTVLTVPATVLELVALDEWVELAEAVTEAVPDDVGRPTVVSNCSPWLVVVPLLLLLGAVDWTSV
jgi:hypothetical protein